MLLPRALLAAVLLAAAAPRAGAFYLPGLAPVNFCEKSKETPDCKVRAPRSAPGLAPPCARGSGSPPLGAAEPRPRASPRAGASS